MGGQVGAEQGEVVLQSPPHQRHQAVQLAHTQQRLVDHAITFLPEEDIQ